MRLLLVASPKSGVCGYCCWASRRSPEDGLQGELLSRARVLPPKPELQREDPGDHGPVLRPGHLPVLRQPPAPLAIPLLPGEPDVRPGLHSRLRGGLGLPSSPSGVPERWGARGRSPREGLQGPEGPLRQRHHDAPPPAPPPAVRLPTPPLPVPDGGPP